MSKKLAVNGINRLRVLFYVFLFIKNTHISVIVRIEFIKVAHKTISNSKSGFQCTHKCKIQVYIIFRFDAIYCIINFCRIRI